MPLRYCPLHGIGYNSQLDPVCPQCSLARIMPAEPLDVDENPSSPNFGFPRMPGEAEGDRTFPNVKGQ